MLADPTDLITYLRARTAGQTSPDARAIRQIIDVYEGDQADSQRPDDYEDKTLEWVIQRLAQRYADRDDFNPAWRLPQ